MTLAPALLFLAAAQLRIGIPMAEVDAAGVMTVSLQVVNESAVSVDTATVDAFLTDANGTRIQAAPARYWIPPRTRRSVSFSFPGVEAGQRGFSIDFAGLPQGPTTARVYFYEDEVDQPVALLDPTAPRLSRARSSPSHGELGPLAEILVIGACELLKR